MTKRISKLAISLIALIVLLLPLLAACNSGVGAASTSGDTLVIYNWEDYIDGGDREMGRAPILNDFAAYYEEVTGRPLNITYTTFDTNETMLTKVLKGDAPVDLICPSEYAIEKLLTAGLLKNQKELRESLKPQLETYGIPYETAFEHMSSVGEGDGTIEPDVMSVIKSQFGAVQSGDKTKTLDMTEYMVPYMWGTLGILYNKAVISEEDLETYGWGVLWNEQNSAKLENKILMKDSVRDTYAAALFYMYEYNKLPEKYADITSAQDLINITDDEMLEAAEAILTEQREHISGYEVDFGKDDMLNEVVYADFAWSGDALWAIEESYDEATDDYFLGYYCPQGENLTTGKQRFSNIWYDGWVIPTTVKNSLAAMMFIDYMCRPENAIRNSIEIGYTCAVAKDQLANNEDVCAYIEEQEYDIVKYFDDIGRYPKINESLGVMRDFGDRNDALVNMWQRAKAGSSVNLSLLIIIAVIIGIILLAVAAYYIARALKVRPRKL